MSVEAALYPPQLNTAWPQALDMVSEGDDHIRLTKTVLKTTFPNVAGAISATDVQINYLVGVTSSIQSQIDSKGAKAGQAWTGVHNFSGATSVSVPTLAQATSTTGAASTAFVQNEWSTRLPNYTGPITASTTELNRMVGVTSGVQSQIDSKGAIAGQTWTGAHSFPSTTTVGPLTPAIQGYLATATSDVQAQINAKAAKAGDTYSGTHNFTGAAITVPTLTTGATGNGAASVDFVNATALSGVLPGQVGNAGKFIRTDGSNASWAWPVPAAVPINSNTNAVAGNYYIFLSGVTLTLPASPAVGDWIGFASGRNVSGGRLAVNGQPVKGRAPSGGFIDLLSANDAAVIFYANTTDGWVQL
ncbi:hypothetical protein [Delftia acidovorans]|uniref:hypothetical protein n=1 Tax=Delftia acidovorans TaxID=80866 RepID=UPI003D0EEDB0